MSKRSTVPIIGASVGALATLPCIGLGFAAGGTLLGGWTNGWLWPLGALAGGMLVPLAGALLGGGTGWMVVSLLQKFRRQEKSPFRK